MKKLFLLSIITLISVTFLSAQNTLTVTITGLSSNDGDVYIGLYDSEKNFLREEYQSKKSAITNNTVTVVFEDVPAGEYAISSFHDENGNGDMDTMIFGIPKEDYGFSNNARGMFGPAKWEDAKFLVKGSEEKQIINY